jgi:hypothetical protein
LSIISSRRRVFVMDVEGSDAGHCVRRGGVWVPQLPDWFVRDNRHVRGRRISGTNQPDGVASSRLSSA